MAHPSYTAPDSQRGPSWAVPPYKVNGAVSVRDVRARRRIGGGG